MKSFMLGVLILFIGLPSLSKAEDCSRYAKPSLCMTAGCAWVAGQCVNSGRAFDRNGNNELMNSGTESSVDSALNEYREYLGCTVDSQQCGDRAARYGYQHHNAERHYACPNAAKFGCWGYNQGDGISGEASVETDSFVNCSYYVKPALCASHRECKWVSSCVPR